MNVFRILLRFYLNTIIANNILLLPIIKCTKLKFYRITLEVFNTDILMPKDMDITLKKNMFFGIIFISLLGSLMHFLYDISGKLAIVGLIAPVNESVWEHLKLSFFPTLIWWAASYFVLKKKKPLNRERWLIAAVASSTISLLFILSFYYTYTGASGFESVFLDFSSLLIGAFLAQKSARHIYFKAILKPLHFYLAIAIFFLWLFAFITFTFFPPKLPLFLEKSSGKYGIQ